MALDFPNRPATTLPEFQRDFLRLLPNIEQRNPVTRDFPVGTSETKFAHGLKVPPRMFHVTPQADARVWETRPADATYIYLQANAAVICNVTVRP